MRLRGIQKNLYLIMASKPEINQKFRQFQRSFEEVRLQLAKGEQKSEKNS